MSTRAQPTHSLPYDGQPPVERHPFEPFLPEGCRLLMAGIAYDSTHIIISPLRSFVLLHLFFAIMHIHSPFCLKYPTEQYVLFYAT